MKRFMRKGVALVLLGASLTLSGLCPVQAAGAASVSGNDPGTEYSTESGTVSGNDMGVGNPAGSGAVSGNGPGTEYSTESGTVSGNDMGAENPAGGGTVSGNNPGAESPAGGSTVSGGDAESGGGGMAGSAGDITNAATGEMGPGEGQVGTDDVQNLVSPHGLTVYPDDRLTQWNMGNSSGKHGNSFDSYAVFDDNVIAALYGLGNDTYRLELTGTGEMAGLGYYDYQPYLAYGKKIVSVTVGEGITNVGKGAFSRFSNLREYTLPSTVKTIDEKAFEYCTSLEAVVIPDTVDSISNYSFYHCEGATSLTLPGDLEYNSLNIPFYGMDKLEHIYITPGKTGAASVSQVRGSTSSPACISDGYTIHFMEGVTEIHDKVFANTKASRIEIADSVTVVGTDAFAKDPYDKTTIPDYIVLGDNTRRIAFKAFMASVETITPTTVEIGNVYQYEYDWAAVRRDVTFVVRLNALGELAGMVSDDIQDGTLAQGSSHPPAKWQELLDGLAAAQALVEAGSSDKAAITDSFIRLYDLYHYEVTPGFVVSVPASVGLSEGPDNRVVGEVPVTVRYLFPDSTYRLTVAVDGESLSLQDAGTGRTLPLTARTEGTTWGIDSSGAEVDGEGFYNGTGKITLSGEKTAGDWKGTLRLEISCGQ